ncbi:MAG TPA: asparagine synthase-related protein [Candidatus Binatia bacterium]|nr:asparagine synthase-related protein [Candidatus Binatia bacterium]
MSHDKPGEIRQAGLSFEALESNGTFSLWSGKKIQLCLDGLIQIDGGELIDSNGPDRTALVETLCLNYLAKGEDFLKDIAGSFRLALWDADQRKLILAVDPLATRPIYYQCAQTKLFFASRISCFSKMPELGRKIDPNALYFYLNHSFIPAPLTIFKGIRRLEPGQYLTWQSGCLRIARYWDIRYEEDCDLTVDVAAERIRSAVERSVRSYFEGKSCAANKLGAFLSGGTDSSTLVGLLTEIQGGRVKTFSVGFAEERYNEIEYARIAASHYNAEAYECFVSAADALKVLPLLAAQFDEPFGNSSAIPTYFCLRTAKRAGVEVMFAGDGGDELFGGNERYLAEKYFLPYDCLPEKMRAPVRRLGAILPRVFPLSKVSRYIERASVPNPERFFHYQLLFFREYARDLLSEDFAAAVDRDFALQIPRYHYRNAGAAAPLNRLLYMDLKMCIADNDLFKVNQTARAVDVEVLYPYLDRYLAELTGRIPAAFKVRGFQKRYLFKKAFENLLPKPILQKKKHGFGMPTGEWLRHHPGFRDLARALLLEPRSIQRGYFSRSALARLLKRHDEESSDYFGTQIWNFMMLELWHRYHYDGLPG